ncbi:ATP/maltotriose-dependent transcriptional regulator MalT [Nocardioides sp. J9]|uniref:helix-turn-helix transcriptional regulator n=1 Tax=Nocardioides sp. J9 TaxID=935844 RepID=UPI0011A04461|nr:LuxR family transcriptional regulator [Nocardioides sp. J9]TWG90855.1 ATP/maltotriose-dependent transcriptional regulator MalT [Nocardioides sp. J9]
MQGLRATTPDRWGLPRLPGDLVVRRHVEQALDQWSPMTLVVAPQGTGRTTALASWLRARPSDDLAVAWVDVLPGEDPAEVWRRVADGLGLRVRRRRDPVAALGRLLRTAGRVVVVLEDVPADDQELLVSAARLAHRHDNLFVLATTLRAPSLPLLHPLVEVTVLDRDDLRLRPEEVVELARRRGVECDELVQSWLRRYDGWAVLVDRATRVLAELGGDPSLSRAATLEATAAALDDEVASWLVDRLVPAELELLTRASHLGRLDARTVARIADDPDPAPLVGRLVELGMLREVARGNEVLLEVPDVVRPALRLAPCTWGAQERRALQRELLEEARREDRWREAFRQVLEMDDSGLLVELFEEAWMFVAYDAALMARVLEVVGRAGVGDRPTVSMAATAYRAWAKDGADWPEGIDTARLLGGAGATPLGRAARALVEMGDARVSGRIGDAAELAESAAEPACRALARDDNPAVLEMLPTLWLQTGITWLLADEWSRAVDCFREARHWSCHDPSHAVAATAASALALVAAVTGDAVGARQHLADATTASDVVVPPCLQVFHDLARFALAVEEMREHEARTVVDGLRLRTGGETWPFVLLAVAGYELMWGDPSTVLVELDRARELHPAHCQPGTWAHVVLAQLEVDARTAAGQGTLARRVLAEATQDADWAVVRRARLAALEGRPEDVLVEALSEDAWLRHRLDLALLQAAAQAELGWSSPGRPPGERAARLLRRHRCWSSVAQLPPRLRERLADTVELGDLLGFRVGVPTVFPDQVEVVTLAEHEQVVLDCLARGLSVEQTAAELVVPSSTVQDQATALYRKLGAGGRKEALARARALGLVGSVAS